jgi:signal transduction histidine kinase
VAGPALAVGEERGDSDGKTDLFRVLVANGDPSESQAISSALEDGACAVTVAGSGEEALSLLAGDGIKVPQEVDVILLGFPLNGPYGRLIRETTTTGQSPDRTPIISIIGRRSGDSRSRELEAGADEVLARPVDRSELVVRVHTLVKMSRLSKELEKARREISSRDERLSTLSAERASFAQKLSHDLRGPLTGIMGHAQILMMKSAAAFPEVESCAKRVLSASQQIQRTLADLRDLGLLEESRLKLRLEKTDLHTAAAMVLDEHRESATACGVDLELEPPRPDPHHGTPVVEADAGLLLRVLGNLVAGAVRYTPPEGTVRLLISTPSAKRVEVHVSDTGDEIHDYAAGIFRNAQATGTETSPDTRLDHGLRMAFCRAVILAHGGRIWVEPNASGGSTFGFFLPVARRDPP